jgi:cell division protease FtsH
MSIVEAIHSSVTGIGAVGASDTSHERERTRQRRLLKWALLLGVPMVVFWYRELNGSPIRLGMPDVLVQRPELMIMIFLILVMALLMIVPLLGAGRSPHTVLRPGDVDIRLKDVVGATQTRREVMDTLNLFLNHQRFSSELGGSPRRGVLFEGSPGTGKTYMAKAMAAEAGVPFLFVAASEFQSMFYGQSQRKVRSFFKGLRKLAREEGGAIGFIEEFDAIGEARSGMSDGMRNGAGSGMVNELLVQMQSFNLPTGMQRFRNFFVERINRLLPASRQLRRASITPPNILVIAATNRASDLDPALLRPGRFDRRINFDLPARQDRLEIAAYYLDRKIHDDTVTADRVADLSAGYTPVRIERLLDEALIVALRRGRGGMTFNDVVEAQLTTEVGLSHDVGYHPDERRRIAVHEAGHALTAALTGRDVKLASILRRSGTLGLVAHGEAEERFLRTQRDALDMMAVALAGRAAEIQEFGDASSGISSDLAAATNIACQLVGQLGMGESLLSLEASQSALGGNLVSKVFADDKMRAQADALMNRAADRAACMVMEHRGALMALADGLCEQDELGGDMVHAIVAAAMVP